MENFISYNPTKIHFGKGVIKDLGEVITKYGKQVLLVYGKGSIKENGVYDGVIEQLRRVRVKITEYSGIKPNPVVDDVEKASEIVRRNNIEVVLAVGGGSVIDSAKVIALCSATGLDAWALMKGKVKPTPLDDGVAQSDGGSKSALPLIAVLTLAGTGTEMNPYAVLQNHKTREKIGYGNELMFPRHSFLDPSYTISVPKDHTAYGIVDLIAHCLEAYFGEGEARLSDRFVIAIIQEAMYYAPLLLNDLKHYDYRANIMWCATCALNGWIGGGRKKWDWGVHDIGHILSFLYDIPHGATLSIVYPAWLKLQTRFPTGRKPELPDKIKQLGSLLFNTSSMEETIEKFTLFFSSLESPVKLSEIGIDKDKKKEIYELMVKNKVNGFYHKLSEDDYALLIDLMM